MASLVAEAAQALLDDLRAGRGVLRQELSDGGFERVELAGANASSRRLVRLVEVLADGAPADGEAALDLADRPAFQKVELVPRVDLFVGQHHGLLLLSTGTEAEARMLLFARRGRSGRVPLSPGTIKTCVKAKLWFARFLAPGPHSQTPAA